MCQSFYIHTQYCLCDQETLHASTSCFVMHTMETAFGSRGDNALSLPRRLMQRGIAELHAPGRHRETKSQVHSNAIVE